MILDTWQQEVLDTKGNICLRSGRQVGKSTIIGLKAAEYALSNEKKLVMVISKTERQAGLLFAKILGNINELAKFQIKRGKDRPTKHKISLKNGSIIFCLPVGDTGFGIMGYTIDLLIADEAAFIPEEVWNSIVPALAITRGDIWLLSTPYLKEGYYYECFNDPSFTCFHQSSEDCPRKDEKFLERQKKTLTQAQYAQMYLGQFVDELFQFFPDELINNTCTLKRTPKFKDRTYYLGVDVARLGEDESTFEILQNLNGTLFQVENIITTKQLTTQTTSKILELERAYNFRRIYVDDAGVGAGVFDQLLSEDTTKRKVVAINNAARPLDRDESRKKKILKEDLYTNLKRLMERKEIKLLDDDEIKQSLKYIQFEYNDLKRLKISGRYSHITEGLIRAAWGVKDKHLNIWIDSI